MSEGSRASETHFQDRRSSGTCSQAPNHFKALDGLGTILREIGQKKAAYEVYKKLLEVHPFWQGAKAARDELEHEVSGPAHLNPIEGLTDHHLRNGLTRELNGPGREPASGGWWL